ncbi:MAG: UDP-N-acetylmuramate dehydrogenase [Clostridia bacterium]|nr:UDP-N-acetylmuramate dehydrogenase [Clostridia bacterium]
MNNISNIIAGAEKIGCKYRLDAPMSEYTSFKTGGKADVVFLPSTELQLRSILRMCSDEEIKPFIFGNGSNLLVSDDGIRGVTIRLSNNFEEIKLINETTIYCTAGTKLATLCKFALEHSLTGLEFAYGIPGTAGGAAYMNAGAYGGEMKDVLYSCNHIDFSGNPGRLIGEQLGLGYRCSAYTDKYFVITGLTLVLEKGDKEQINAKMQELLQKRIDKQPLDLPSAGSFFKRPEGNFAGALIEQCGLKGFSVGGAQVSVKHAGFVVNKGGATTADIMELGILVSEKVLEETGVQLEREVKYIG